MEIRFVRRFLVQEVSGNVCCRRHFLLFRFLLTNFTACIIHQSIRHSMRITAITLERRRCGGSIRKAIFGEEVSTFCRSVAIALCRKLLVLVYKQKGLFGIIVRLF
jgi:hypothetical protein